MKLLKVWSTARKQPTPQHKQTKKCVLVNGEAALARRQAMSKKAKRFTHLAKTNSLRTKNESSRMLRLKCEENHRVTNLS